MNFVLTICFVSLSLLSFSQSKKKQNQVLKSQFETLKKEQEQLYSAKTILNSEVALRTKRFKILQIDFINLTPIYLQQEAKTNHLFRLFEQLKLDANIDSNGELADINLIQKLINEFKEHESENKLSYTDGIFIVESFQKEKLSISSENTIYRDLINKLELNIYDLKLNIAVFEKVISERDAILSKIEAEISILKKNVSSKASLIDILEREITKAEQNFRTNGPKGFSKEYFQVFPEAFPDYTSEGVKKPTPKKEKLKTTKNEIVKPESEIVKNDTDENNYKVEEIYVSPEPMHPSAEEVQIYDIVDEKAQFPGGHEALIKFIIDNLKLPQTAIDMGIEGKCYLKFIVSENGYILNATVKHGVRDCPECDKEAIRLVKSMPNWIPARVNGKSVNSTYTLPITFKLD